MADGFAYFGGIDFSGAREPLSNLWTAVGREEEGGLTIQSIRPHAFRQDLCSYVADGWRSSLAAGEEERVLWGADFPFGLPADAAAHVCGEARWSRLIDWVADRPADEVRGAVPEATARLPAHRRRRRPLALRPPALQADRGGHSAGSTSCAKTAEVADLPPGARARAPPPR